ncbi:hypothetical protein SAMN05920897_1502 [Alkalispirochaeta americana]|uniref:Uncharacterized protein n=1 Tax=Alkalispirochaeta americana TaxID=159291 RepID=A0A1N6YDS0_9SPIO|nr:hypothetical protein SAMN05920897_1502 [Alkalispirochaeta americana]
MRDHYSDITVSARSGGADKAGSPEPPGHRKGSVKSVQEKIRTPVSVAVIYLTMGAGMSNTPAAGKLLGDCIAQVRILPCCPTHSPAES